MITKEQALEFYTNQAKEKQQIQKTQKEDFSVELSYELYWD